MFAAGTAVVAAAHQVIFLSQEKMFDSLREQAMRVDCASNMRQIGQALLLYAQDHGGALPPDLETLQQARHLPAEILHCAGAEREELRADHDPDGGWPPEAKYIYIGKSPTIAGDPTTPLLVESVANHGEGGNVLFLDGHVRWQSREEIEALFHPPPASRPSP